MALNKPKQANETAKNEESSEDDVYSDNDLPPLAEAGTSPGDRGVQGSVPETDSPAPARVVKMETRRVKLEGCNYRMSEEQIRKWLSLYGTIVSDITEDTHPFEDEFDTDPCYNGCYILHMMLPKRNNIPQIVPMHGELVKLHSKGIKKLCTRCFGTGHKFVGCKKPLVRHLSYVAKFMKANPQIPGEMFGRWVKKVDILKTEQAKGLKGPRQYQVRYYEASESEEDSEEVVKIRKNPKAENLQQHCDGINNSENKFVNQSKKNKMGPMFAMDQDGGVHVGVDDDSPTTFSIPLNGRPFQFLNRSGLANGDSDEVSDSDTGYTEYLEDRRKDRKKSVIRGDRLFKTKKYRPALEQYDQALETFGSDEEDPNESNPNDPEDPYFESRLNAAVCHMKLKNYGSALEHLRYIFRLMPEEDFTAEIFFRLATCFLMTYEVEKSIFVAIVGIDRFAPGDVTFLRQLLSNLSQRYRPALLKVQEYINEIEDFEVGTKDIFIFMEKLPVADNSEYLMSVEDFVKEGQNVIFKTDTEVTEEVTGVDGSGDNSSGSSSALDMGNLSMTVEKAARAYRANMFGVASHEFSVAISENPAMSDDVRCILTYCQSMSNLHSRSLENIKSGLTAMESLTAQAANRPYIYYGLAKYLIALKRPETDVTEVIEKGLTAVKEVGEKKNTWPFELLSEIFKENQQSDLQTLFDDLSQELKNPGLPTAICRHEKCLQIIPGDLLPARTAINLSDVDFKGYYTLICQERCILDFHSQCWKHLKEEEVVSNDKEFLGRECLTPDCDSSVVKIVITKESGQKKEIEAEEVISTTANSKAPSKWKNRGTEASEKRTEKVGVEKQGQTSEKSDGSSQSTSSENKPSQAVSKMVKKTAPVVKKESSCLPETTTEDKPGKAWPPDPSTCPEFTPENVYNLQELDWEMANQQAMEREKQLQQEYAEETGRLSLKIAALEKERSDLAKKLEDGRIHSKRQNDEISRLKNDLAAEQQTTFRLLHQNEKLQTDMAQLKRNVSTTQVNQDFILWRLAHEESSKYVRLMEYLHSETIFENSPTLARSIREHRQFVDRSKRQLDVYSSQVVNRESIQLVPTPIGLDDTNFRSMTSEVDQKMVDVTAKIKTETRNALIAEQQSNIVAAISTRSMQFPPPPILMPPQMNLQQPAMPHSPSRHVASPRSTGPPPVAPVAPGSKLDKVVETLRRSFPNMSRDTILSKIDIIRKNNNGKMAGLTVGTITEKIRQLEEQANQQRGATASQDFGHQECAICMEDMSDRSNLMTLNPCGHKFHKHCISSWFQEKRDCPFCRVYVVPPDDFPHLQKNPPYRR